MRFDPVTKKNICLDQTIAVTFEESSTCALHVHGEMSDGKPVLERLQQYLKDKNPVETAEVAEASPPELQPAHNYNAPQVDLNQNTIFLAEDRDNFDLLAAVLDHKKAQLLRQPDVIRVLSSIAKNHKH